jgi:molybdate/tungstate transport system substrate-binding protein
MWRGHDRGDVGEGGFLLKIAANRRGSPHGAILVTCGLVIAILLTASPVIFVDAANQPLRLLYAGSLVALMENDLAPAFTRTSGVAVQGRAGGSVALAHMILDGLQRPDVFVSADPAVNKILLRPGLGPSAPWFLTFAGTTMVLAYSPHSRFAPEFRDAAFGGRPWYEVLSLPGLRLGRTDPRLDPKGYRTILMLKLAEQHYHLSGLRAQLLGASENPAQIFPEEALVGRLESGQLDAGVFYLAEVLEHDLPYVTLPDEINLGNPAMAWFYAGAAYTDATGAKRRGKPILYTVTIPSTARNLSEAVQFVQYLFGPEGQRILGAHGLLQVRILVGGDWREVPPALQRFISGTYDG